MSRRQTINVASQQKGASVLVLMGIVAIASGCNRDDGAYGNVKGVVTFQEKPVPRAQVLFHDSARFGFYSVAADNQGRYDFSSFPNGGLPVGEYRIAVQPPRQEFVMGEPLPPPAPFVKCNAKYLETETSDLATQVISGEVHFDIHLMP